MQTRFKYTRSNQPVTETALTYKDGTPREIIKQGNVGTMFVEGTPSDKYLYNRIAFDSPLEKENIMTDIDEVVVYGKIPKSSIAIPTIVGENYSPDFMYVVKHKDGTKELNIVVETKLVEKKSTLRSTEDAKIKCAEAFFKQLRLENLVLIHPLQNTSLFCIFFFIDKFSHRYVIVATPIKIFFKTLSYNHYLISTGNGKFLFPVFYNTS